jgi:signal transduction histidine kinase
VINNSGEGMNKEELKRVCKTFLKEKVAGLKSGVGIGLATAKELCQSLDGDI